MKYCSKILLLLLLPISLIADGKKVPVQSLSTIEEEEFVRKINAGIADQRKHLVQLSEKASVLLQSEANEGQFKSLLEEFRGVRQDMALLEKKWRETMVEEAKQDEEGYALWDQEETTLAQLIMEYGALDYLYIVPPEMAFLKLNIHSGIPIPR